MRSLLTRVSAALLAPVLLAALVAGPAQAAVDTGKIVKSWKSGTPVYQDPSASVLTADDVEGLNQQVRDGNTKSPIFVAILSKDEVASGDRELLGRLVKEYDGAGSFILMDDNSVVTYSNVIPEQIDPLTDQVVEENRGEGTQAVASMLIDKVAQTTPRDTSRSADGAGVGGVLAVGLGVLLLLAVLGGLVAFSARRKRLRREEEQFQAVQVVAEEDVTKLGEDVTQLDLDVRQADLDPAARSAYEKALDAYDRSKNELAAARRAEDLRKVTEALDDGRYEMTCVRARLDGQPMPARRAPCFFNPQHGPSVGDRPWAPPGGTSREVPVCAADAEILDRGQEPAARHVMVDGVRRPYWEGGPAYAPWYGGYYGSYGVDGLLTGMLLGSVLAGGFGGFGGGFGGDFGGGDFGDGDFGGGDFGGGDFGGGDFGGFGDFGGGDF